MISSSSFSSSASGRGKYLFEENDFIDHKSIAQDFDVIVIQLLFQGDDTAENRGYESVKLHSQGSNLASDLIRRARSLLFLQVCA